MEESEQQLQKNGLIGSQKYDKKEHDLMLDTQKKQKQIEEEEKKKKENDKKDEIKNILAPDAQLKAEQFREAMKNHMGLAVAEKAAKGEKLQEFIPADRGFGGWKERKKDELSLWWKKKTGLRQDIDLDTYRITEKWDALDKKKQEKKNNPAEEPESVQSIIKDALKWKLSWSMLDSRYFRLNAERMHEMFHKSNRLKQALVSGDPAIKALPPAQQQVLASVVNIVSILHVAMQNKMFLKGVFIRGKVGEKYLNTRRKTCKPTLEECRRFFQLAMKELHYYEKKANLSIREFAEANESELKSETKDESNALQDLLQKQNTPYIKSGNARYIDGLVSTIRNYRNEPPERVAAMYKNLSVVLKSSRSEEENAAFCREMEGILKEILIWDLSDFEYHGPEDIMKPDYKTKRKKLYMVHELDNTFKYYREFFNDKETRKKYCTLSEELFHEASARIYTAQSLHAFHEMTGGLLSLDTDKSLDDWYSMSGEQCMELANTYRGQDENNVRTQVSKLALLKLGAEDETNKEKLLLYTPGSSISSILRENRKLEKVPDDIDTILSGQAEKNLQEAIELARKEPEGEFANEKEKKKAQKERFEAYISDLVRIKLCSQNPSAIQKDLAEIKYFFTNIHQQTEFIKKYQLSMDEIGWMQQAVADTISEYIKPYTGMDLIEATKNHILEQYTVLLPMIKDLVQKEVPADFAKKLVKDPAKGEKEFKEDQLAQKMQYIALMLMNTEVGQKRLEAGELSDEFTLVNYPLANYNKDLGTVADEPASLADVLTDAMEEWVKTNCKTEDEKVLFNVVNNYLKFPDSTGFQLLNTEKADEVINEVNAKRQKKFNTILENLFK